MFRDTIFSTAFVISLSVHLIAFSPWSAFYFNKSVDKPVQPEVTYIIERPPEEKIEKTIDSLPEKYDLEQKKVQIPQKTDVEKNKKSVTRPLSNESVLAEKPQYIEAENLEAYISYYKLLREKIKRSIDYFYPHFTEDGEVCCVFSLDKSGALKKIAVDLSRSTGSRLLDGIAVKSVKAASPFPPFPAGLKKNELIFSISIIFRKD